MTMKTIADIVQELNEVYFSYKKRKDFSAYHASIILKNLKDIVVAQMEKEGVFDDAIRPQIIDYTTMTAEDIAGHIALAEELAEISKPKD